MAGGNIARNKTRSFSPPLSSQLPLKLISTDLVPSHERQQIRPLNGTSENPDCSGTFNVVKIEGDGNCLFRCFSYYVHGDQTHHAEMRKEIVDYVVENWRDEVQMLSSTCEEITYEDEKDYAGKMGSNSMPGTDFEVGIFMKLYKCRTSIFRKESKDEIIKIMDGTNDAVEVGKRPLNLLFSGQPRDGHWEVLEENDKAVPHEKDKRNLTQNEINCDQGSPSTSLGASPSLPTGNLIPDSKAKSVTDKTTSSTSAQSQAAKSEFGKSKDSVIGNKAAQFALIAEVHQYRLLWDKEDPHSDNKELKAEAWRRIGKSVGESAPICERRWAAIKMKLSREKNRVRTSLQTGTSVSPEKSKFLQSLQFLTPKRTAKRSKNEDHEKPSSKKYRSAPCGNGDRIRRNTASSCPKMDQLLANDIAKAFESHSFVIGIWMKSEIYNIITKANSLEPSL